MAVIQPNNRENLEHYLETLKLNLEALERAITAGASWKREFSEAAPSGAGEYVRWAKTVENLHQSLMLLQQGWKRFDTYNMPYFVNIENKNGLIVSSGDSATGLEYTDPSTRNPKGEVFSKTIEVNNQQSLFNLGIDDTQLEVETVWVLLYDERDGYVHVELARPHPSDSPWVTRWLDRIIIPAFDVAGGGFTFEDSGEDDDDQFGFTIARR